MEKLSLVLSIISIVISVWFWKNPIDTSFTVLRTILDKGDTDNIIAYQIGKNNKGWLIEKRVVREALDGKIYKTYASVVNNPATKSAPDNLKQIKKLNFN